MIKKTVKKQKLFNNQLKKLKYRKKQFNNYNPIHQMKTLHPNKKMNSKRLNKFRQYNKRKTLRKALNDYFD